MKEITTKLRDEAHKTYGPLIMQLHKEGVAQKDVFRAVRNLLDCRVRNLYKRKSDPMPLWGILKGALSERDSKIEDVFYSMLVKENGTAKGKFGFAEQYKIGSYRVDFLINDFLIVEIDGPHHQEQNQKEHDERRDKYLRKMGYKILRIPTWVLALSPESVMDEIRELSNRGY